MNIKEKLENIYLPNKKKKFVLFYIIITFVTMFFILGITNIELDNDLTVLLPVNAETVHERETIKRLNKEFPSDQVILIGIKDAFNIDKIKILKNMCDELDKLPVIKSTMHPFNAAFFKKIGDTFSIQRSQPLPTTLDEMNVFVKNLSSNRYLVGSVISYDGQTAGVVVRINKNATMGEEIKNKNVFIKLYEKLFGKVLGPTLIDRAYFCSEVEKVIKKYEKNFGKIYYAGVPVYEAKTKQYVKRDIVFLLIPALLIMAFVLYLSTKTKRGTILPLIAMLLSLLWTLGLIGWFRYKINLVGVLMPPIILTIGSSYTLHFIHSYYSNTQGMKDARSLLIKSSKSITPTISMAALTTMAGFASFWTASIATVRVFGLFINISILFTLLLTYLLLPRVMINQSMPEEKKVLEVKNDRYAKIFNKVSDYIFPLRYFWTGLFILSFVLFIVFVPTKKEGFLGTLPSLKVETNAANFFKESDDTKQSLFFLQDNFHGTTSYCITIRSKQNKRNYFKTREGLLVAKKFQEYIDNNVELDGFTMIGWNLSPVTLVQDLNYVMKGKYDIPEDEKEIKRFFSFLSSSGDDGIKSIINNDFSAITFQIRSLTNNPKTHGLMTEQQLHELTIKLRAELKKLAEDIEINIPAGEGELSDQTMPETIKAPVTVEVWGEVILLANISKYMIADQILNIISTFIFIFIILLILFRSLYYSIVGSISHTFGVLMNFAIMSLLGIPLDASTIMIAAITIGVGVDAAIHFLIHFKKNMSPEKTVKDVVISTQKETIRPIVFSSLALFLGFSVFIFSSFKPVMYFGLLIAMAILNCTIANLFILPAIVILTDKIRRFSLKNILGFGVKK